VQGRYDIAVETYNKTINVEGQLMVLMANRYILPAAIQYQTQVAESVAQVKAAGATSKQTTKTLTDLVKMIDDFKTRTDDLAKALEHADNGSPEKHAKHYRDAVVPRMASLRESGDVLETVIPHELWPLPTYREMLFIK
jgi:glutamine synthetase